MTRTKMLLAAVVAATGLAVFAPTADAQYPYQPRPFPQYPPTPYPPRPYPDRPYPPTPPRQDHDYAVYIRHGGHWDFYGRYETRSQADRVACGLEHRGHEVRIRTIHDHR